MKSFLLAGILSLTLHGALLLTTIEIYAHRPPRPFMQEVICIALHGLMEGDQTPQRNSTTSQINYTKPARKEVDRPANSKKQLPASRIKVTDPAVIAPETAKKIISPVPEPPVNEGRPASHTAATEAPASAYPAGFMNERQQTTEASPLYRENPPPAYPALARRRGLEGTVLLDVLVTSLGSTDQVRISTSSGNDLLDRAAVSAVEKWLFLPGKKGNQPVDMWVRVPIRFALHD